MMLARVSNIEALRQWKNWRPLFEGQEEPTVADLVKFITTDEPTEAMLIGTAFHKTLETAQYGEHEQLEANGLRFLLPDCELQLPTIREMRAYREYGGLTVTGQVDAVEGRRIIDHKTTSRFDPDRYLEGCQYRFYLDLFDADEFVWNVFEVKQVDPDAVRVSAPHVLKAYRYPEMRADCERLAADYLEFARAHLPEQPIERAA